MPLVAGSAKYHICINRCVRARDFYKSIKWIQEVSTLTPKVGMSDMNAVYIYSPFRDFIASMPAVSNLMAATRTFLASTSFSSFEKDANFSITLDGCKAKNSFIRTAC